MYFTQPAGGLRQLRGRGAVLLITAAYLAVALVPAAVAAKAPRPDLTIKSSKVAATGEPGGEVAVSLNIKNAGGATSRLSVLSFAFSADKSPGSDTRSPTKAKMKKLRQSKSKTLQLTVAVPSTIPDGAYYVIACVDASKKIKEASEKNNCRASLSVVSVARSVNGTLSGTLTLLDRGEDASLASKWDRTATANVNMTVTGRAGDELFASTGSTYNLSGYEEKTSSSVDCVTTRRRNETGAGTLVYRGDAYSDEVTGKFTKSDLSGLGVTLDMPYVAELKETVSGPVGPCSPGTTVSTTLSRNNNVIKLTEVARTSTTVTYRAVEWFDQFAVKSDWDSISGDLVLTLK